MMLQRRTTTSFSMQAFVCLGAISLAAGLKVDGSQLPPAPAMPGTVPAAVPLGGPPPPPPAATPPTGPILPGMMYDKNGLDWTDGMCFSRERQSPINFDDHIKDPPSDMLKYHYEPLRNVQLPLQASKGLVFIDTSHLRVGEVVFNGDIYPLVRIDFHANSEHLLRGKRYSMEIQLVHRKINDPTKSLVIAVPVWSENVPQPGPLPLPAFMAQPLGPYYPPRPTEVDYNAVLQQFLTVRPPYQEGMVANVVIPMATPLDLGFFVENPMLPDSGTYIQYAGSLTTPPCSDMTTWFVRRRPMIASDGQTKAFADSIFRLTQKKGNFRGVMPVNQRVLKVYRAQWVLAVSTGTKRLPLGPNARTDKEFEAEKLAEMAKEKSQDAVDYMADFGKRLRRSARALTEDLNKANSLTTPSPANFTLDEWDQAVMKMRGNMQEMVNGVQGEVDKHMRHQTMKVHKRAAREGERARQMTAAWMAPDGSRQGVP